MGTGASTKRKETKGKPASRQRIDSPSLERRRRLLLGRVQTRPFERVPPREQFHENPPQDDDPVFIHWRNWEEVNAFRKSAEDVQVSPGWLGSNSLELLDPFQPPGSPLPSLLAPLLLKVAQVQRLGEDVKRGQGHLTFYELLALHSALRWAAPEVLLELLYCVFDCDGDDNLSVKDLHGGISAFLELQEASGSLVGTDLDGAFNPQDEKARDQEARRLAVKAIKEFGGVPPPMPAKSALPEALTEEEEEEEGEDEEDSTSNPEDAAAGAADAAGAGGGTSSEASDSEESGQSNLSTTPVNEGRSEGKRKTGKEKKSTDVKVPQQTARKRRGFNCCARAPPDESADEGTPSKAASDSKKAKTAAKAAAKAATKEAAKKKKKKAVVVHQPNQGQKGACLIGGCGPCGRKQRVLTFPQWQSWLTETGLLPEGLLPPPEAPGTLAPQTASIATGAGVGDLSDEEEEDDDQFMATKAAPRYAERRPLLRTR